jgi:hypothetical protein
LPDPNGIVCAQEKYNAIKVEFDQVSQNLTSEVTQNQERKKKVRDFINTSTAEKSVLEARIKDLEEKNASAASAAEDEIRQLQDKISDLQQTVMDKDNLLKEQEQLESQLRAEVDNMQEVVAAHSTGTQEQIQEIQRQLRSTKEELEGSRTKRMAARTEMIGLSQALEKAQKEGEGLKVYMQNTISPLVFEQVNYLETLVTGIELAHRQITSKSSYRIHSVLADVVKSLCFRQAGNSGDGDKNRAGSDSLRTSMHSDAGITLVNTAAGSGAASGFGNGSKRPGGAAGGASSGVGSAAVTAVASAHEQAQTLKAELERVKSGLILLAQSMEKLQDSVRADSRCCGGVSEVCETTTSRTTTSRFRVGITGRRTAGYDRVDGGGGLYEDDYDDVSVNNRNGGRASSSVISPLGMAAVGRGGAAAGVGMRTGNAADAGKFTIESQDDDGDV